MDEKISVGYRVPPSAPIRDGATYRAARRNALRYVRKLPTNQSMRRAVFAGSLEQSVHALMIERAIKKAGAVKALGPRFNYRIGSHPGSILTVHRDLAKRELKHSGL